jgi:rare lipoprotein A (peptidoglycan hydrolase)
MKFAKPLFLLTLSYFVISNVQAQVGEKFYGRASYYADKFHGRTTSSGEIYDRTEYTAAHRELPFNTIVEVINTTNNRTAVVKINDRGPFAYNRMIDLSFAAAKDLELLGPGEAEVEMRILAMDKPEYSIPSFYAGIKDEFKREFTQYEPIEISGKNVIKVRLDTTYNRTTPMPASVQPKPVTESFVVADSLRKRQEEGDKMGFRQHKYIRVIKDADGRYRLDSTIVTPPTPQEAYSVAPQNRKFANYESRAIITKTEPQKQVIEPTVAETQKVMKSVAETVQAENRVSGFRQYQYVRVYTDNEGRIRMDTAQKAPITLAKNTENQATKSEEPAKNFTVTNTSNTNSTKPTNAVLTTKSEDTKGKEVYKDGFRQHSYIKVYKDKDGKTKIDDTSFERPK